MYSFWHLSPRWPPADSHGTELSGWSGKKRRNNKNKIVFFFFFQQDGLEISKESCFNYLICFWIQHRLPRQGWTSCGHTLKICITAPSAAASENPWMSSRLPLYLLQTVKELTCRQELSSCWQKHLTVEAAERWIPPTHSVICSPCTFFFHWSSLYYRCSHKPVINITTPTTNRRQDFSLSSCASAWRLRRGGDGRSHGENEPSVSRPSSLTPLGSGNRGAIIGNCLRLTVRLFLPLVALRRSTPLLCV